MAAARTRGRGVHDDCSADDAASKGDGDAQQRAAAVVGDPDSSALGCSAPAGGVPSSADRIGAADDGAQRAPLLRVEAVGPRPTGDGEPFRIRRLLPASPSSRRAAGNRPTGSGGLDV